MAMTRVARVSFVTARLEALETFYREAFGFERIVLSDFIPGQFANIRGLEDARASNLQLGDQILELVSYASVGAPCVPNIAANDLRFQHIAIVVSDMPSAYERLLQRRGWAPITRHGPQHLPASSGGVTAFKFRDPEGHPLELLAFPASRTPPAWQQKALHSLCLGIDHSAITVADTQRSIQFYQNLLGFSVRGQSLNSGREQGYLDDLTDPILEVTSLSPATSDHPHLELLCYRRPESHSLPRIPPNAAVRLVMQVEEFAQVVERLSAAAVDCISYAPRGKGQNQTALLHDPDGHELMLTEAA